MTIPKLNELVQTIDIEMMFVKAVQDNEHLIIDQLTENQLIKGINEKGEKIGDYESNSYAQYKYSLNTQAGFGNVDLKLTGDLYSGLALTEKNKKFYPMSSVPYFTKVRDKYGAETFGMTEESKSNVNIDIKESVQKQLKDAMRL